MTNIIYKIVAGFGECRKIHGISADTVRVEIDGVSEGFLSIGEMSCRIKNGVGRIHLDLLADGEYAPVLFTETGVIRLEKILKCERGIRRADTDEELITRALARLERAERDICELRDRLASAESAIQARILL